MNVKIPNKNPMTLVLDGWTYVYCGPVTGFVRYQTTNEHSEKTEESRQKIIIENSNDATPTGGNDSY